MSRSVVPGEEPLNCWPWVTSLAPKYNAAQDTSASLDFNHSPRSTPATESSPTKPISPLSGHHKGSDATLMKKSLAKMEASRPNLPRLPHRAQDIWSARTTLSGNQCSNSLYMEASSPYNADLATNPHTLTVLKTQTRPFPYPDASPRTTRPPVTQSGYHGAPEYSSPDSSARSLEQSGIEASAKADPRVAWAKEMEARILEMIEDGLEIKGPGSRGSGSMGRAADPESESLGSGKIRMREIEMGNRGLGEWNSVRYREEATLIEIDDSPVAPPVPTLRSRQINWPTSLPPRTTQHPKLQDNGTAELTTTSAFVGQAEAGTPPLVTSLPRTSLNEFATPFVPSPQAAVGISTSSREQGGRDALVDVPLAKAQRMGSTGRLSESGKATGGTSGSLDSTSGFFQGNTSSPEARSANRQHSNSTSSNPAPNSLRSQSGSGSDSASQIRRRGASVSFEGRCIIGNLLDETPEVSTGSSPALEPAKVVPAESPKLIDDDLAVDSNGEGVASDMDLLEAVCHTVEVSSLAEALSCKDPSSMAKWAKGADSSRRGSGISHRPAIEDTEIALHETYSPSSEDSSTPTTSSRIAATMATASSETSIHDLVDWLKVGGKEQVGKSYRWEDLEDFDPLKQLTSVGDLISWLKAGGRPCPSKALSEADVAIFDPLAKLGTNRPSGSAMSSVMSLATLPKAVIEIDESQDLLDMPIEEENLAETDAKHAGGNGMSPRIKSSNVRAGNSSFSLIQWQILADCLLSADWLNIYAKLSPSLAGKPRYEDASFKTDTSPVANLKANKWKAREIDRLLQVIASWDKEHGTIPKDQLIVLDPIESVSDEELEVIVTSSKSGMRASKVVPNAGVVPLQRCDVESPSASDEKPGSSTFVTSYGRPSNSFASSRPFGSSLPSLGSRKPAAVTAYTSHWPPGQLVPQTSASLRQPSATLWFSSPMQMTTYPYPSMTDYSYPYNPTSSSFQLMPNSLDHMYTLINILCSPAWLNTYPLVMPWQGLQFQPWYYAAQTPSDQDWYPASQAAEAWRRAEVSRMQMVIRQTQDAVRALGW